MNAERKGLSVGGGFVVRPLAALVVGLLLALLATAILQAPKADAAVDKRAVSKAIGPEGYPVWYQDAKGRRLDLCLDGPPLCLAAPGDLTPPEGEAFWWQTEAAVDRLKGGGDALLVMGVEAAFAGNAATDQISFGRVRIRATVPVAGATYRVTHPYGVRTFKDVPGGDRGINFTQDIPAAGAPGDFESALRSPVFASFLRWDPNAGRAAPDGYIGDPTIPHRVVGSPTGNNFFLIEQTTNARGQKLNEPKVVGRTSM